MSTIFYAGTNSGVFRSFDEGGSWRATGGQFSNIRIRTLVVNERNKATLYSGGDTAVYRSTNGGESWEKTGAGSQEVPNEVLTLALDPLNEVLYAGTAGVVKMFRSSNRGDSWEVISDGILGDVRALLLDPQNRALYAGTSNGIYRSLNLGESWEFIIELVAVQILALNPATGTIFAGSSDAGLYRSIDGGQDWQPAGQELSGIRILSMAVDPKRGILYAGTATDGVFRSIDDGQSWEFADSQLPGPKTVLSLAVEPERGTLYAGTNGDGVFRFTDAQTGWQPVNKGLSSLVVYTLAVAHVEILPGGLYWKERFPVERNRLRSSREALRIMRAEYEASDETLRRTYPWRLGFFPATGLPAFLRLRLPDPLIIDDKLTSPTLRTLLTENQIQAIFGLDGNIQNRLDDEVVPGPVIRLKGQRNGSEVAIRHLTYHQVYKGYRVVGGSVRIHGLLEDSRTTVTSSYFPIPPNYPFVQNPAPDEEPLTPRLTPEEAMQRAFEVVLQTEAITDKSSYQEDVSLEIVSIDGRDLAVMAFEAAYRLISRVRVQAQGDAPWYVDVDVKTGQVLGFPWQAVLGVPTYYKNSGEAVSPGSITPSGSAATIDMAQLQEYVAGLPSNIVASNSVEMTNVAAHAEILLDHLLGVCDIEPNELKGNTLADGTQPPGLRVEISTAKPTGFSPDEEPKLIHFEHDTSGNGLAYAGGFLVYSPARDAEVVMHEFTHGFLCLFNSDPWDVPSPLNPFSRALQEGYATYLARSVAAIDPAEEPEMWARAAYSADKADGTDNWGNRWAFGRNDSIEGADFLPAPNVYPVGSYVSGDLPNYDVGMVWARALWDLRQLLGGQQADKLAVQAYAYLHGYIANFELAAEGLLDTDIKQADDINLINGSQPIWAERGILAGQGVHGFAQTSDGSLLIAATDAGILESGDQGISWTSKTNNFLNPATADTLTGVVAVAAGGAGGNTLYAAVQLPTHATAGSHTQWEPNIFSKSSGDVLWQPVGNWPVQTGNRTPLSLQILENDNLMVGSSRGIYIAEPIDTDNDGINDDYDWIEVAQTGHVNALDLALVQVGTRIYVYSCSNEQGQPDKLRRNRRDNAGIDWLEPLSPILGSTNRLTAITGWPGNGVFVGTIDGLFEVQVGWTANSVANITEAVLALTHKNNHTYCATDQHIYVNNGLGFVAKPLPDQNVKIISLFVTADNHLVAGTLAHGIWRSDANVTAWTQVHPVSSPTSIELSAAEVALLSVSIEHPPTAYTIEMPVEVNLLNIAQPGFPFIVLAPGLPTGNAMNHTYTFLPPVSGPLIFVLQNTGPDTTLAVAVSSGAITLS